MWIRKWLSYKLGHLEEICPTSVIPIRKVLASLWIMPDLVEGGFRAWKEEPPEVTTRGLVAEDIEIASRIEELGLEDSGDTYGV